MTIPATHAEIEQLYLAAEMQGCRSICITSCNSGDGVTSVATALAERYLLSGLKTLVVDLNTFHPSLIPSLSAIDNQDMPGMLLEHEVSHKLFTGVPAPTTTEALLEYRDPRCMKALMTQWLSCYDRVVCDTSPILLINRGNIPAQVAATACDQTAIVVLGGSTTTGQLEKATQLLSNESISLLGSVFNLKNQPTLAQEMVRELNRIPFLTPKFRRYLQNKLFSNELLNQH
ncbi:chromosome partitioning protein ParA [Vibrio cholerae]